MNFSANLPNKQNDKRLSQLNKTADKHRVKKIIALVIGLLLAVGIAGVYYKSMHSHQVKTAVAVTSEQKGTVVENINNGIDKNNKDKNQTNASSVLNNVLQANGMHDKIQALKNALSSSAPTASSNLINTSNSSSSLNNNTKFNRMNGAFNPNNLNKNQSAQSISLNSKQMGINSPVAFTVGTDSQSASLTGQDLGLNFPLTLGAQYSRIGGYTVKGQIAHSLGFNNAYALGLELGTKQQRYNATLGHVLSAQQRIKLTGEYLKQDLNFDFDSGKVDQWVGQWAYGLAYQYIVPKGLVNDINLKLNYSKADSKDLGTTNTLASTGDVISSDYRRIAGATDKNVGIGVDLLPTKTSLLGLELDYDSVKYDMKNDPQHLHVTNQDASGLGGKISLEQLINKYLKFKVSASNRKPNNDYEAEVDWLVSAKPTSRLEMGVTGGYTNGGSSSTLPSDTRVGLNLNYTMGSNPLAPETFYSVDNTHKSLDNLVQWTTVPAVYMMQVLAIKDELISKLYYVKPGTGPTSGGTSVTLVGENIGDEGVPAVLFGNVAAVGITKADNNKINLSTPAHAAGIVDVTMTKPTSGQVLKLSSAFEYVDAPNLPSIGLVGGNSVITINVGASVSSNRLKDNFPQVTLYDSDKDKSVPATVISSDQGKVTFRTPDATPNGYDLTVGKPLEIRVDGIKRSTFTYYDITSILDKTTGVLKIVPKDHEPVQGLFAKTAELDVGPDSDTTVYKSTSGEIQVAPDGTYIALSLLEPEAKAKLKNKVNGRLVIPLKAINLQGQAPSISQADYAVSDFKYEMSPVILNVTPSIRLTDGKDIAVNLSGYSFDSDSKACVDGDDHCSATSATDSDVNFNIAKSATGAKSVKLYVKDATGTKSGEKAFDYADIVSDATTHKAAKGEQVTINAVTASGAAAKGVFNGAPKVNFYNDAQGQQSSGTANATLTADKDGVNFVMPELNATKVNDKRVVYVQVVNGDNVDKSSLKQFTYTFSDQPVLSDIVPPARLLAGDAKPINLNGHNFTQDSKVCLNGGDCKSPSSFVGSESLTFNMLPAVSLNSVSVTVKNGELSSVAQDFTYADIQDGASASQGPDAVIASVDADKTAVPGVFTGEPAIKFYSDDKGTQPIGDTVKGTPIENGSKVKFTMPDLRVNKITGELHIYVQVTNGDGLDKSSIKAFTYNYIDPVMGKIAPAARLYDGVDKTIDLTEGGNFVNDTKVIDADGVAHATTFVLPTELKFVMAKGDKDKLGTVSLRIQNPNGAKSLAATTFTYADIQDGASATVGQTDAAIKAVKDAQGTPANGVFIDKPTINFINDQGAQIGTTTATSIEDEGSTIKFTMPALDIPVNEAADWQIHVQVINGSGLDKSSVRSFTYKYTRPDMGQLSSSARLYDGPVVGENIDLTGDHFVADSKVADAEGKPYKTDFSSSKTLKFYMPPVGKDKLGIVKLHVENPHGAQSSTTADFTYADIESGKALSYGPGAAIRAVDASGNPVNGVFTDKVVTTIKFYHVDKTPFAETVTGTPALEGSAVMFLMPNLPVATNPEELHIYVQVVNAGDKGVDQSSLQPFIYNYNNPVITTVTPEARLLAGGDANGKINVTVDGQLFDKANGADVCIDGTTTCYQANVESPARLTFSIPGSATANSVNIYVKNKNGAKSATKSFAYADIKGGETLSQGQEAAITAVDASGIPVNKKVFTSIDKLVIHFYSDEQGHEIGTANATSIDGNGSIVKFTVPADLPVTKVEGVSLPIYVRVVNGNGDQSSLKSFSYSYNLPNITTVAPPARLLGGDVVTVALTGEHFAIAKDTKVCVVGTTVCYNNDTVTDKNLTFKMPGSDKVNPISIYIQNPNGAKSEIATFTYADIQSDAKGTQGQTDATITAVDAPGKTSDKRVFTGSPTINFSDDKGTSIGTVTETTVNPDGNKITFKMPDLKIVANAGDPLTVTVYAQVINGGGRVDQSSKQQFKYTYSNPIITDVTPTARLLNGNSSVKIDGSGFVTGATVFTTEATPISLAATVTAANAINVVTTPRSVGSNYKFKVTNPGGAFAISTGEQKLTYADIGLPPGEEAVSGDTNFIITTTGNAFRKDHVKVMFNGVAATGISVSETGDKITCKVPYVDTALEKIPVVVTNLKDDGSDADYSTVLVSYVAVPAINNITPTARLVDGERQVVLTGKGFIFSGAAANITEVYFNGATEPLAVEKVTVKSATEIDVITPAFLAGGNVNLQVKNPESAISPAKQLKYDDITLPATGRAVKDDATFTITATEDVFKDKDHVKVTFNDTDTPHITSVTEGKTIICTVPNLGDSHLANVKVVVANFGDTGALDKSSNTKEVEYYAGLPRIDDVKRFGASPALVLNGGGTLPGDQHVIVTGANFSGGFKDKHIYLKSTIPNKNEVIEHIAATYTSGNQIDITGIPVATAAHTGDWNVCMQLGEERSALNDPCSAVAKKVSFVGAHFGQGDFTPYKGDTLTDYPMAAMIKSSGELNVGNTLTTAIDSPFTFSTGSKLCFDSKCSDPFVGAAKSSVLVAIPSHDYGAPGKIFIANGGNSETVEHAIVTDTTHQFGFYRTAITCEAVPVIAPIDCDVMRSILVNKTYTDIETHEFRIDDVSQRCDNEEKFAYGTFFSVIYNDTKPNKELQCTYNSVEGVEATYQTQIVPNPSTMSGKIKDVRMFGGGTRCSEDTPEECEFRYTAK